MRKPHLVTASTTLSLVAGFLVALYLRGYIFVSALSTTQDLIGHAGLQLAVYLLIVLTSFVGGVLFVPSLASCLTVGYLVAVSVKGLSITQMLVKLVLVSPRLVAVLLSSYSGLEMGRLFLLARVPLHRALTQYLPQLLTSLLLILASLIIETLITPILSPLIGTV